MERAKERRKRFMLQKALYSVSYQREKARLHEKYPDESQADELVRELDELVEKFQEDEEAENTASQNEDMKMFLNKMNDRIDLLVDALRKADGLIAKQQDHKSILDHIREKRVDSNSIKTSVASVFKKDIRR